MSEREKSCEERIAGRLASRLEDFRAFNVLADAWQSTDVTQEIIRGACEALNIDADEYSGDAGSLRENAQDRQYEYPLHVSVERVVTVLLSTGGPHDEFRVTVDDDGEPVRIEYVFQDWFDGASRYLNGDEFDTAAEFLRPFVENACMTA